jgi:response regulator RpfG family c-di-GMP phosphodiesterase
MLELVSAHLVVPDVDERSKREDLKKVARLRIHEWKNNRVSSRIEKVNSISRALGESYRLTARTFERLTSAEREAVTRWEKYCDALYDAIPEYLLELVK